MTPTEQDKELREKLAAIEHEQFWQAVCNFSKVNYVLACDRAETMRDGKLELNWVDPVDTFYWEGKNDKE